MKNFAASILAKAVLEDHVLPVSKFLELVPIHIVQYSMDTRHSHYIFVRFEIENKMYICP